MKLFGRFCVTFLLTVSAGVCLSMNCLASGNRISTEERIAGKTVELRHGEAEIINFGVERLAEETTLDQSYLPLMTYLGTRLGKRFILNYFADDAALLKQLRAGRIQVAHFSSQAFARCLLENTSDILYIATVSDSSLKQPDFYYGYIFTHHDSPAKTLKDLRGKAFAFVNQSSSSGYSYPLMMLLKAGIEPDSFFSRTLFLGNHPAVTDGVLTGKVYAGATYDGNFRNVMEKNGPKLKILSRTPPIPNEPWVAGSGVSKEFIAKLRQTLIRIRPDTRLPDGRLVMGPAIKGYLEIDSFTIRDASFYRVVMDMLKYTGEYQRQ